MKNSEKGVKNDTFAQVTVDLDGLTSILQYGQSTARAIAEQAEARVYVGHRTLYSVEKIKKYIDRIAI